MFYDDWMAVYAYAKGEALQAGLEKRDDDFKHWHRVMNVMFQRAAEASK